MIPPSSFIPIAEKSGLIVDMGRWLLREALLARQRLSAAATFELRMAVNVSPVQVRRPDFANMVIEVLRETATPASALEIAVSYTHLDVYKRQQRLQDQERTHPGSPVHKPDHSTPLPVSYTHLDVYKRQRIIL